MEGKQNTFWISAKVNNHQERLQIKHYTQIYDTDSEVIIRAENLQYVHFSSSRISSWVSLLPLCPMMTRTVINAS